MLLDWAKGQSSGSLHLYTFARNRVARAFYERHGFVIETLGFEPTWELDDVLYRWDGGHCLPRQWKPLKGTEACATSADTSWIVLHQTPSIPASDREAVDVTARFGVLMRAGRSPTHQTANGQLRPKFRLTGIGQEPTVDQTA